MTTERDPHLALVREEVERAARALHEDLLYAAPEMWLFHMIRRMEDLVDTIEAETAE